MKIKEILELTKEKPLAELAKDHLSIGEKMARKALSKAGCFTIVGQSGWHFGNTEDPANLEKSIYDFAEEVKQEERNMLTQAANLPTYERPEGLPYRKRHSFDLDVRLIKELKLRSVQQEKQMYIVVEDAIRDYLNKDNES